MKGKLKDGGVNSDKWVLTEEKWSKVVKKNMDLEVGLQKVFMNGFSKLGEKVLKKKLCKERVRKRTVKIRRKG